MKPVGQTMPPHPLWIAAPRRSTRLPYSTLIVSVLLLFACATSVEPFATQVSGPIKVDGPAARQVVFGGARLVDVRAPDFYALGHIEGAINIPVAEVESRAAAEIGPPPASVVLYCRTGKGSANAAATLVRMGYRHVYDLGSYLNWGDGAPAPTPLPALASPAACESEAQPPVSRP